MELSPLSGRMFRAFAQMAGATGWLLRFGRWERAAAADPAVSLRVGG